MTPLGVSSQRRKSRKAHFTAPSNLRRKIMSCHLSKDLKTKYDVRSIPVRKGDTVKVMRGTFKGREGKVITCYRKKWCIHVEKITREKTNGIVFSHLIRVQVPKPRFLSTHPTAPSLLLNLIRIERVSWRERRESPRIRTSTRKVLLTSIDLAVVVISSPHQLRIKSFKSIYLYILSVSLLFINL